MYPITKPREGQRVTVFNGSAIGTILGLSETGILVRVLWDGREKSQMYHPRDLRALIPGNDDGYFDGPPGYASGLAG